jgi:SAM-dependent methyltransferase
VTATDWDTYAQTHRHNDESYLGEPVQRVRAETIVRRVYGKVLDVGGGDGYIAGLMRDAGCDVTVLDISTRRLRRARHAGFDTDEGDAERLPYPDDAFDCVVLGEVLEHLDRPGVALAEAFRVSRDRVVASFPLFGWEDPTHRWRIAVDMVTDDEQIAREPTKGRQVVMTWEPGPCWPVGYAFTDDRWARMFLEGR